MGEPRDMMMRWAGKSFIMEIARKEAKHAHSLCSGFLLVPSRSNLASLFIYTGKVMS